MRAWDETEDVLRRAAERRDADHEETLRELDDEGVSLDPAAPGLHRHGDVEHASDLTLQANHESHLGITDEEFFHLEPWTVTQLCEQPERARAVGGVLWQGQPIGAEAQGLIKVVVGEDWIVQRVPTGELKFALYINTHHQLLPDSAPFSLA